MSHPCLRCGACCAVFRVAFHWLETDTAAECGGVPRELAVNVGPHKLAMRGTEGRVPRCVALRGNVGESVACTIYAQRPSPCRELQPAWQDGVPSAQCDRARQAYGLAPLCAADWPVAAE